MRINALNSFNFTGRNDVKSSEYEDQTPDYDYESSDTFETNDTENEPPKEDTTKAEAKNITGEDIKKYVETVKKAGKDVKLPTIVGAVATFAAILAKGTNVSKGIVNTAVLIGEKACNTAVGVAGKVAKSIDTASTQQKISKAASSFIANGEDTKLLENIRNVADKIYTNTEGGVSLGDKITGAMKKFGVVNTRDLISLAGAGTIAATAANGAADKFENALDKKQINEAKEKLENKKQKSNFVSDIVGLLGFSDKAQTQENGYEVMASVANALIK